MQLFNAHAHPPAAPDGGVRLALCCGTRPEDWAEVLELSASRKDIFPLFGLHPWFTDSAGTGWPALLEKYLMRSPRAGVGEIGLDKASKTNFAAQEEAFRVQLKLAGRLNRPSAIHCVRAWGRLREMLAEERPPAFILHSYGGPPELIPELAELKAYFSFGAGITGPLRERMRKALPAVPPERLLFESEDPDAASLVSVISSAAFILEKTPDSLAALAGDNLKRLLGIGAE